MASEEAVSTAEPTYLLPQWRLMWRRFRRHRIAVVGAVVIVLLYVVVLLPEFFATDDPHKRDAGRAFMQPQKVRLIDGLWIRPYVHAIESRRNLDTLKMEHAEDTGVKYRIRFFVSGAEYKVLGLFRWNVHLFGARDESNEPVDMHVLGTDRMGRDMWSRLMYGTRISLTVGLLGVTVSLFLGVLFGGVSGYRGGLTDLAIQRLIEFLRSMPTIPLWLVLAAAIPVQWSNVRMYFLITLILSLIAWTTIAREVRGRFLVLREEDFVMAARLYGTSQLRVIFRHMVPSFASHLIATTTLAIPTMIIAETSLSFLGLGLRPPTISWGVLLYEAQNIYSVADAPWLLIPGLFVIVTVLSFNFMGDGLRDAADPYAHIR